ncbi:23556_t:CDS:2 [Cetraspora pellucida]|uniref:23556_t:CDS:1 n=1 Tax=Cetraspora pellucida TaxID=1433469 RepID=A0A9N8WDC2_9GLOM|nr:23556_t:CDS:2 [Cetraspora pellucida]
MFTCDRESQTYYSTFLAYYYKYGSKKLSSLEKEEIRKAKEKLLTKLQEVEQEVTEIIEEEKLIRVIITIAPDTTPVLHTIKIKVPRRYRFIRTISEEELACLIIYTQPEVRFSNLKSLYGIRNFNVEIAEYIQWRNELEIKFTEMDMDNILTVFRRFSRNPNLGYTMQQPDYDSGADLPKAYWNMEFFKRIKLVIYTKLHRAARRLLTTNPNVNCYFRVIANQNELNNLKDSTNYPITVGVNYAQNNWHNIGLVGRSQCTYQTPQISLRELLDNAYLTDEIQLERQKDFQNLIYKPDYGTENDIDNFRNRYEETIALSNFT